MSKHEMKEDKFVTSMMEGAAYARENVQNVVIVIVVLLVLIAGIVIWRNYRSGRIETANTKLGIAQLAYKLEKYGESKDSLISLTGNYAGTKAAKVGLFLLGHIYFATGQRDSAEIYWNRFIESDFDDKDLRAGARMGLAAILSDKQNYAEAGAAFEKCYEDFPDYFDRGNWLYRAADNYLAAGQTEKAKELYQKYVDEYGDSPWAINARLILAEIEAK